MTEITNKIYYVGVNDRNKHRFEGLWPLPNGVSYNSYIIDDEKVALVDTVEVDFFTQFLENIHEVIGDREIDYLIINHMEPDHSGSIALIKKYYPNIKIVGNKKTLGMLEGFYGVTDDVVEVKNGETLSLGSHELSFVLIPMVHWPETLETMLVAVVNAYVINLVCNLSHNLYIFIIPSSFALQILWKHNCICPCSIRWRTPGRSSGDYPIAPLSIRGRYLLG